MEGLLKISAELALCKKEKQALELIIEELNDFIEEASTPLHRVNMEGIITWANKAELDLLGYSKAEYIGMPVSNFHVDEAVIKDILQRLLNFEDIHNYPARLICRNGSIKHVLINSSVYKKDGKFIHTKCFTSDITERINETKRTNDFVAVVSHELKTPLTTILSYIQVLLSKAKKGGDVSIINALSRTEAQAKKMASMIKDFLSMSRMQEGKLALNMARFDVQDLLTEIVEDAAFLTSAHTLKLVSCEKNIVTADREKIGYVIMNLLSNAIKYSPMGGLIIVGCHTENGKVNIFVKDEGVGISKHDQQRLFERFYRVDNDKNKTVPGFGIGLYLASEILLYHNSMLKVESEVNMGATFYFNLEDDGNDSSN